MGGGDACKQTAIESTEAQKGRTARPKLGNKRKELSPQRFEKGRTSLPQLRDRALEGAKFGNGFLHPARVDLLRRIHGQVRESNEFARHLHGKSFLARNRRCGESPSCFSILICCMPPPWFPMLFEPFSRQPPSLCRKASAYTAGTRRC